jgi:formylglycine-generating enzyme required for sulfatase activity
MDWVEIPACSFRVGLEPQEAERLATIQAARAWEAEPESFGIGDTIDSLRQRLLEELLGLLPAHEVHIAAFAIARLPVSNADFLCYVQETGAEFPAGWKRQRGPQPSPEEICFGATWEQADAYARWAGARLPTEPEWERTARGIDRRLFPWGREHGPQGLLVDGDLLPAVSLLRTPLPVPGVYRALATPEGVFDLGVHGHEWTSTGFEPYPGADLAVFRKRHPTAVPSDWVVNRGGGDAVSRIPSPRTGVVEAGQFFPATASFRLVR